MISIWAINVTMFTNLKIHWHYRCDNLPQSSLMQKTHPESCSQALRLFIKILILNPHYSAVVTHLIKPMRLSLSKANFTRSIALLQSIQGVPFKVINSLLENSSVFKTVTCVDTEVPVMIYDTAVIRYSTASPRW